MTKFATGKHSLAISDRSGQAFPYLEMVREWNGAWVHFSEFESKSPQLQPKPVSADPQALKRARPARTAFFTPSVLNNTPASPAPILTDDLEIKMISKIDNSIIGNPIFGKFFIFNNYLS